MQTQVFDASYKFANVGYDYQSLIVSYKDTLDCAAWPVHPCSEVTIPLMKWLHIWAHEYAGKIGMFLDVLCIVFSYWGEVDMYSFLCFVDVCSQVQYPMVMCWLRFSSECNWCSSPAMCSVPHFCAQIRITFLPLSGNNACWKPSQICVTFTQVDVCVVYVYPRFPS